MVKRMLDRWLRSFERRYKYDASYMHEVLATDLGAFTSFGMATRGLGGYRKDVPLDVYFAAGLISTMHADCGPCTQLGVDKALESGVPAALVRASATP